MTRQYPQTPTLHKKQLLGPASNVILRTKSKSVKDLIGISRGVKARQCCQGRLRQVEKVETDQAPCTLALCPLWARCFTAKVGWEQTTFRASIARAASLIAKRWLRLRCKLLPHCCKRCLDQECLRMWCERCLLLRCSLLQL